MFLEQNLSFLTLISHIYKSRISSNGTEVMRYKERKSYNYHIHPDQMNRLKHTNIKLHKIARNTIGNLKRIHEVIELYVKKKFDL